MFVVLVISLLFAGRLVSFRKGFAFFRGKGSGERGRCLMKVFIFVYIFPMCKGVVTQKVNLLSRTAIQKI